GEAGQRCPLIASSLPRDLDSASCRSRFSIGRRIPGAGISEVNVAVSANSQQANWTQATKDTSRTHGYGRNRPEGSGLLRNMPRSSVPGGCDSPPKSVILAGRGEFGDFGTPRGEGAPRPLRRLLLRAQYPGAGIEHSRARRNPGDGAPHPV